MSAFVAVFAVLAMRGAPTSSAVALVGMEDTVFVLFGCTLFAAALFVYVFYQPGEVDAGEEKTRHMYLQERKDATYENLRDLNFEYRAGKYPEEDFVNQRALLENETAQLLAEIEHLQQV